MSLSSDLNEYLATKFMLVLEPAMNYRTSLKSFLTNLKVKNVRYVSSAGEAKREMLTIKVGIFIVEWQLPEKNGLQFCRDLRKDNNYKTAPFLLLGTENLRSDVMLASEGGINSYLLKPFSYEDFCAQISNLLKASKNPSPFQALLDRAEAHFQQNELWVAEALFREALTMKPQSAKAICGIGRVELAGGNIEEALTLFHQSVTTNPDFVEGYKYILDIAQAKEDHQGIIQAAGVLRGISPENPRYPLLIAFAHMELGLFLESESFFKMSIRLSPTLADGYRGLGTLYLQQKEYEKARKTLEKALDLDKRDVSTLNALGLALVRNEIIDEGIRRYRLALSIDPNDFRVHFNLGLALELKGDLGAARESFKKALNAKQDFTKAARNYERIGRILNSAGDGAHADPLEDAEILGNPLKKGA